MKHLDTVTPTHWLVGARENVNIWSDFSLRILSLNFPHQADVLVNNIKAPGPPMLSRSTCWQGCPDGDGGTGHADPL